MLKTKSMFAVRSSLSPSRIVIDQAPSVVVVTRRRSDRFISWRLERVYQIRVGVLSEVIFKRDEAKGEGETTLRP